MDSERRRVVAGPAPDDNPGGIGLVRLPIRARRPISTIVDRVRDVMIACLDLTPFDAGTASAQLPSWFVEACIPEPSPQEQKRWLAWWQSLDRQGKIAAEQDRGWTLAEWLSWMEPAERPWQWWDLTATSQHEATLMIQVEGWPTPTGALEWLIRTAGGALSGEPTQQAADPGA